jgi:DNA-binding MarR family transcriptional regulator
VTTEAQRLRAAIARTDRLLNKHSGTDAMTRTQRSVLGAVARMSPHRLSGLAAREGLNPTMLSRVVGSLETDGLVRRRPADDDGRQIVAEITPAGAVLYERHQKERTVLIEDYVASLSASDATRLWKALPLLEGLAEHLQAQA